MKLSSNLYSNKKWMHFLLELLALATQNELTHDLRKRWISVSDTLLLAHHQHQNHWTWKRKQQIQSRPSRYFIQVLILIVSSWTRGLEGSLQLAAGIVYRTILEIFGCSVTINLDPKNPLTQSAQQNSLFLTKNKYHLQLIMKELSNPVCTQKAKRWKNVPLTGYSPYTLLSSKDMQYYTPTVSN